VLRQRQLEQRQQDASDAPITSPYRARDRQGGRPFASSLGHAAPHERGRRRPLLPVPSTDASGIRMKKNRDHDQRSPPNQPKNLREELLGGDWRIQEVAALEVVSRSPRFVAPR